MDVDTDFKAFAEARRDSLRCSAAAVVAVCALVVATGVALRVARPAPDTRATDPTPATTLTATPPVLTMPLSGTWTLHSLVDDNGHEILTKTTEDTVRVTFEHGQLSGTTACNSISGPYVQADPAGADVLFPAPLMQTQVACNEPPLSARLAVVRHLSVQQGDLYLHASNWTIVAVLRPA